MANEARISASLSISKGALHYPSQIRPFRADVTGTKGPSPGAITVTTAGTDVSFAHLVDPGLCEIINLDATNFVTVGLWEPDTSLFYPLLELLPGEGFALRLSRYLSEQFMGTGTGTGTANQTLRIKADTASCVVVVNAFER